MDVDPVASMRIWAVELFLGGQVYEIPALPAADWLPLLMEGDLVKIFDLIEGPDLDEMIISGGITAPELFDSIVMAVEQVGGRPIHQVMTLAKMAQRLWDRVGGDLARHGFRWDEASLSAALDAIYTTTVNWLKPEGVQQLNALLDRPPPSSGQKKPRINRERALADFEDMAGPRPTSVPSTSPSSAALSGGAPPRTRRPPRQLPPGAR